MFGIPCLKCLFVFLLLHGAPSAQAPAPLPSAELPAPGVYRTGRPLESLLGSSIPPKGRINYACSIPDISPEAIYSSAPLFLYLTYLFLQFKPITSFPLHVGMQNRTFPSPSSTCRLLCPCPTATERKD